jgi:hypothetical protein
MGGTKLQNSKLKEENMESMKANYKIPTLKRRTWNHESKLQNSNLENIEA